MDLIIAAFEMQEGKTILEVAIVHGHEEIGLY